jgi:hypothetical protein
VTLSIRSREIILVPLPQDKLFLTLKVPWGKAAATRWSGRIVHVREGYRSPSPPIKSSRNNWIPFGISGSRSFTQALSTPLKISSNGIKEERRVR